jgi:hypothetical protein
MRVVARQAQCWVTTGPLDGDPDDEHHWWEAVDAQRRRLDEALAAERRDPPSLRRMLLVPLRLPWAQSTPPQWDDFSGRLAERGFTDVTVHWPRPHDPDLPGPSPATFAHVTASIASSRP